MRQNVQYDRAVYLDMEWTCWDTVPPHGMKQEIIEIGIVSMDLNSLEILDEASYFVRPKRWEISLKCTQLTGINHEDILKADSLRVVLEAASVRFEPKGVPCYAWGEDVSILTVACKSNGIANPFSLGLDLAALFQGISSTKDRIGLMTATEALGLGFDGFAHGALPDARNAAKVHRTILKRLCSEPEPPMVSTTPPTTSGALSSFAEKLKRSLQGE